MLRIHDHHEFRLINKNLDLQSTQNQASDNYKIVLLASIAMSCKRQHTGKYFLSNNDINR